MKRKAWVLGSCAAALLLAGGVWQRLAPMRVYTDADSIRAPEIRATPRKVLWQPPRPLAGALPDSSDIYEPKLSWDGLTLYFVRGKAGFNADICITRRSATGWTDPKSIVAVCSEHEDLGPEPSADGSALYFYSDRPGGSGGYDLWVAYRSSDAPEGGDPAEAWGTPINLGPSVNSEFNDYGPALSHDGATLYFASSRPQPADSRQPDPAAWRATVREDLYRRTYDLYCCAMKPEGIGPATPLTALNTPENEGAPCMSPAGDFLYFASDRRGGIGGFDLYRSRLLHGTLLPAENLGESVNSPANELDPALAQLGFALYFSSDRVPDASQPAVASRPASQYRLYYTASREVFGDFDRRTIDWAAMWRIGGPALLYGLLGVLAVVLLALLRRDLRDRRLSLLARCLVASLAIHCLLLTSLGYWRVKAAIVEYAKGQGGPIQVSLASAGMSDAIGGQILAPLTDSGAAQASPVDSEAPPASFQFSSDESLVSLEVAPSDSPPPISATLAARDATVPSISVAPTLPPRESQAVAGLPPPDVAQGSADPESAMPLPKTSIVSRPPSPLDIGVAGPETTIVAMQPAPSAPVRSTLSPAAFAVRESTSSIDGAPSAASSLSQFDAPRAPEFSPPESGRRIADAEPARTDPVLPQATERAVDHSGFSATVATETPAIVATPIESGVVGVVPASGNRSREMRDAETVAPAAGRTKEWRPSPSLNSGSQVASNAAKLPTPGSESAARLAETESDSAPIVDVAPASTSRPPGQPSPASRPSAFARLDPVRIDRTTRGGAVDRPAGAGPSAPFRDVSPSAISGSPSLPARAFDGSIGSLPVATPAESTSSGSGADGRGAAGAAAEHVLLPPVAAPLRQSQPIRPSSGDRGRELANLPPAQVHSESRNALPSNSFTQIRDAATRDVQPSRAPVVGGSSPSAVAPLELALPDEVKRGDSVADGGKSAGRADFDSGRSAPNAPTGTLRGRVTDAESGRPLEGATVRVDHAGGVPLVATSDARGRYELLLPVMPENFAVSAAHDGYVPDSRNVPNREREGRIDQIDFSLQPESETVIAIEDEPEVHHIGNDAFEGEINSQFQRRSEGPALHGEFTLLASQAPPHVEHAAATLLVKGVQCPHRVYVNGVLLAARIDRSPPDGGFGDLTLPIEPRLLRDGLNTLDIRGVSCRGDLDDFEFVNVQIRLRRVRGMGERP
ncbi:MAG: PD40 domain-containing protein [Planctomycetes bacterium]|nr:PD40 domain-containing protein [Planctomycetota bacterium]